MKKYIIFFAIFLLGLTFASPIFAQETIRSFDVSIKINQDASISVSERIEYDFDDAQKRGIFRDIPIKYQARGGNFLLRVSDVSVVDENDTPYNFTTSYPGNNIQIKIGDADKLVAAKKVYVINYKIKRAINYFSNHDELYWNATGNGWQVPIKSSSATIVLPQKVGKDKIQTSCFSGAFGSQKLCASAGYSEGNGTAEFSETNFLPPGQGLTVVFGWPKNIVQKPSALQNALDTIKDNWILFLPLATFLVMLYLWSSRGRDPKGRGAIYPQYDAPDGLTPAQIGTLIDEKVDAKDISSEIIYLATKGYLKITRTENKGIIFKSEDYLLEKIKDQAYLPAPQKRLMDGIFQYTTSDSIKLSGLKNRFYKELPDIKNKVSDSLVSNGYFPESPGKTKRNYIIFGLIVVFACSLLAGLASKNLDIIFGKIAYFSAVLSGLIVMWFGSIMPVKTKKGVDTKENIFGLKMYLEVAEKDRLKFHNAPAKNPAQFEKLLPFAMVLGVEREWAKQFEEIYNQPPSWYSDPSSITFNSLLLINGLNNFSHSANAALVSAPRSSASSGGSGFGGGGHSGGGFGGGGGGSW